MLFVKVRFSNTKSNNFYNEKFSDSKNEPNKIVTVVGIGHMPGILKLYHTDQRAFIKDMLTIPPPSKVSIFVKMSFRVSLYVAGGYLIYRYAPVPKFLKKNIHILLQQMLTTMNPSKINFINNKI